MTTIMTDTPTREELESINKKHRRLRGSDELKYPQRNLRCRSECGVAHYRIDMASGAKVRQHPCFLIIGHEEPCEFSSECDAHLTVQMVGMEVAVA